MSLIILGILIPVFVSSLRGTPRIKVSAQDDHKLYFPVAFQPTWNGRDDFEDNHPEWRVYNLARQPEDKDGGFRYAVLAPGTVWEKRVLRGEIRDNAVRLVASPPWLAKSFYRLDMDARFHKQDKQSFDSLGIVFGGNSDFSEYYAFLLAYGADQHFWAIVKVKGYRTRYLDKDKFIGAPGFVRDRDGWNHLTVIRFYDKIFLYINDRKLLDTGEDYHDSDYGANRRVGVVITSYELNFHDIDFDDFELQSYE
jgi:hypothetical protein